MIHILGCLIFLSVPVLFSPDFGEFKRVFFLRDFTVTVLLLVFFYVNYYYLTPAFYIPKKYTTFFGLVFLCCIIILLLPELLIHHRPIHIKMHDDFDPTGKGPRHGNPFFFLFNHHFLHFGIVFIFSMLLKIREQLTQTETEKSNAELNYLKAQINPHFLFNTLNTIYSLSILKSDKTSDAVVKLSDMMRYVLSDGNTKFVSLEKELNYISNYIELQRIRLTPNVKLIYECEGNRFDKKIAPLVLIPFIENAFKHGVNSEENSEIEIKINITDTELELMVKNNCVTSDTNTLNKSGLGIENTRQRLSLLYPESHKLDITEINHCFIVRLKLSIHD